jgi:hypothetical protein
VVLGEFLLVGVEVGAAAVDDAFAVHQGHVGLVAAHGDEQAHAGQAGGAGAEADQLDFVQLLALHFERVEQAGAHDHGSAVLVVVKDGDVQARLQRFLDLEAVRRGDVFQVDAAEGRRNVDHGFDEAGDAGGVDLDVEHVDAGEALEQDALAFHHRLAGQRAQVAQAEDGGAVGDHRDQIALVGVAVGVGGILGDLAHRLGDAGGVGQGQFVLGGAGLGGFDGDFSGTGKLVVIQGLLVQIAHVVLLVRVVRASYIAAMRNKLQIQHCCVSKRRWAGV